MSWCTVLIRSRQPLRELLSFTVWGWQLTLWDEFRNAPLYQTVCVSGVFSHALELFLLLREVLDKILFFKDSQFMHNQSERLCGLSHRCSISHRPVGFLLVSAVQSLQSPTYSNQNIYSIKTSILLMKVLYCSIIFFILKCFFVDKTPAGLMMFPSASAVLCV